MLGLEVAAIAVASFLWAFWGFGPIRSDRFDAVTQGILQVVGFLIAGYTAGSFLFYNQWAKEQKRLSDALSGRDQARLRVDGWTGPIFTMIFAPLIWFVISALLALDALATGDEFQVRFALSSLGIGFGFIPVFLFQVNATKEQARKLASLLATNTPS